MVLGRRIELAGMFAIVLLGLLLRLFAGRFSITENGILPIGYDEYYHLHRILYTVNHFPNTLWFDSYLNYPFGFNLTWPPLFDLLSAAVSLMLGQHSRQGVEMTSAFLPAALGVLTIVIVYYIVKETINGNAAILSALMVAIAPYHVNKTLLGATDHHCLEILLEMAALLFMVLAISRREKRYLFAALAGISMAGLAYTWLGADVYLGIFLDYAAVQIALDLKRGVTPKESATALLAAFGTAIILIMPFWNADWLWPSFLGASFIIVGILLMYALAHLAEKRKIHWAFFPLMAFASICTLAFISLHPSNPLKMYAFMQYGADYIFGGEMIGKIAEAEPIFYDSKTLSSLISSRLGVNILFALMGFISFILYVRRRSEGIRPGQLLLLVWSAGVLVLTFGQMRFLYISTIAMGILISILFFVVWDMALKGKALNRRPEALAAVLLMVLIMPTALETAAIIDEKEPMAKGDWCESLDWLSQHSSQTSYYDNPKEAPEYGVMCWWDYGNWIVYLARRPVVANNFQVGAVDSARFYLSESEDAATAILDERRSRYILIDYDMLFHKLPSLVRWTNLSISRYIRLEESDSKLHVTPLPALLNTTMARLYLFDGAGMSRFRLIHESHTILGVNSPMAMVKIFEYVPGALIKIKVKAGSDHRVGALLNMTSNQGRIFTYTNEGMPGDNGEVDLAIRVPYATESRYGTHALGPYLIFCEDEKGVKMKEINVSEQDVLEGRIIKMSFI